MKDEHLMYALRRALARYGSPELPLEAAEDAAHRSVRPRRPEPPRGRRPGWISIGEIEASQSPNSYPRMSRRAIKTRCLDLMREADAHVKEVRTLGLRTWVRVAFAEVHAAASAGGVASGEVAPAAPVSEILVETLHVPSVPVANDVGSTAEVRDAGPVGWVQLDPDERAPDGTT